MIAAGPPSPQEIKLMPAEPISLRLMSKVRSEEALLIARGGINQQSTCGRRKESEVDRRERPADGRERKRERYLYRERAAAGPAGGAT